MLTLSSYNLVSVFELKRLEYTEWLRTTLLYVPFTIHCLVHPM
jgi:hypothetical protein